MLLLVRSTNWLGDVVLSLPAVRALRSTFPKARLAILARPWVAELYRLLPEVDEVLVEDARGAHASRAGRERLAAELRARGFDRAVLFPTSFGTAWTLYRAGIPERIGYAGDWRRPLLTRALAPFREPGVHQVWKHLRVAQAAGAEPPALPDCSWSVPPAVRQEGQSVLHAAGWDGGPLLVAHVASFENAAKRWPLPGFTRVFDELSAQAPLNVALLGSNAESAMNADAASRVKNARVLDLSGRTSLAQMLGVLSHAAAFVGNDSGIAHLASAVGAPGVVIFGPTDPEATRPWDGPRPDGRPARLTVVRSRVACAPCRFTVCPIDHACMTTVPVERVISRLRAFLS